MIINLTTKEVRTLSSRPHDNWIGEGWAVVPAALETMAAELAPYCKLKHNKYGEITDIVDDGTRPEPTVPQPTEADELRAELLETQLALCEMFELVLGLTGGDA